MSNKIIEIENATIRWTNFSGRPDKFNVNGGKRYFTLFLTPELEQIFLEEGYNVRYLENDENMERQPIVQCTLKYGEISPNIYMVTSKRKTLMEESNVGLLDNCEIANVDLIIRPYNWEVGSKTGVSAYVKTMYCTIVEDSFASKYDFEDEPVEMPFV